MSLRFSVLVLLLLIGLQSHSQFHIYMGDTELNNIRRISEDGTEVDELFTINTVRELEINPYTDKLWYIDNDLGIINRCNLDGTGMETMVSGLTSPNGIVLDHLNQRIFYSSSGTDQIFKANMDGSDPTVIMDGDGKPTHVELACGINKVFWTDYENGRIVALNDDGSDSEDILTGLQEPKDMEIHLASGMIYWVEGGDVNKIRRSTLTGENIEDVFDLDGVFASIEFDYSNDKLYCLDLYGLRLYRMDLDGSNSEVVFADFVAPAQIAVVSCEELCSEESVVWCGEGPYVFEQDTLIQSGSYNFIYDAVNGCDSVFTLHFQLESPVDIGLQEYYELSTDETLSLSLTDDFENVSWSDGPTGNDWEIVGGELGPGTYEFTVWADNLLYGCALSFTFIVEVGDLTTMNEISTGDLSIYPNPIRAGGRFVIDFSKIPNGMFSFRIHSLDGQMVNWGNITEGSEIQLIAPDSPGAYILLWQNGESNGTEQLLIQ